MTGRRIVVISDFQDGHPDDAPLPTVEEAREAWASGRRGDIPEMVANRDDIAVDGGYIERLPLACLKAGLVDSAEIWTHWRGGHPPETRAGPSSHLKRRVFRMNGPDAPFASNDMLGHIAAFGAPHILCVWGLGVSEEILLACRDSFKIYNSIDAPALRIPPEVSRYFDLILTGAQWQSDAVHERHPDMPTAILPIGPEFASDTTFHPLDMPKTYDIIYVAAAQSYKRHDILFDAMAKLPRSLRALCVCGYGELTDAFRQQVAERGISVDIIDPPGVPFEEVNRLMNTARIGVVCGVDDGAPAILTEYMLAGLPVLANSALSCGGQFITPKTGRTASAEDFHLAIADMLKTLSSFDPRAVVRANWTWPHSIRRLEALMSPSDKKRPPTPGT
ncbi:glycosyltransferase family 4 protein [Rhizobiaceae bacterium CRRU44]|uniref:Glycosyltransferase family 4 protein n=1 Tax=Ferranicluibacter rubi TaxID=2715133 RepID=A0AA44CDS5_9HYPH|nr:glycosyltransferase [Ferranicluibacter rubi]NHT77826.1 glycosyltransferase family 4 protein [Ferranicluibacter rubi]